MNDSSTKEEKEEMTYLPHCPWLATLVVAPAATQSTSAGREEEEEEEEEDVFPFPSSMLAETAAKGRRVAMPGRTPFPWPLRPL